VDGGVLVFGKPAVVKPVARLDVSPEKATAGDPVRFSARNSTGADGLPAAAFLFDFGDGNSSGWVDLPTVEHGYAGVGNYTASLRVSDTSGITSNETILTVVVDNLRPYGVSPGGPLIAYAGRPVIFHPHGSDPDGYIARYEIDFDGDGVIDASGDDLPANLTHLYSGNGTFRPTLTVYDDAGARACASEDLWVRDAARPPVQNPPPAAVSLPVAAASVSVVALAAAGAGLSLTEFGKYRFLTIFFVPLYVRLKKDEVLDNYVRGQIHGYIIANPGDHYNSIRDALELSNGIVAHHIHTLEREGLVQSMRDGMYRRFFPANAKLPPEDEGHFNIQKRIVAIIRDNPGISQKEIAQKVGVSSPTVNYHVGVLATARMIRVEKFGRRTHCYVIDQQPQN